MHDVTVSLTTLKVEDCFTSLMRSFETKKQYRMLNFKDSFN